MRPYCPFKMSRKHATDWYCEEQDCGWWEEYTEMCSIKTMAFLRGIGAERQIAQEITGLYEAVKAIRPKKEGNND